MMIRTVNGSFCSSSSFFNPRLSPLRSCRYFSLHSDMHMHTHTQNTKAHAVDTRTHTPTARSPRSGRHGSQTTRSSCTTHRSRQWNGQGWLCMGLMPSLSERAFERERDSDSDTQRDRDRCRERQRGTHTHTYTHTHTHTQRERERDHQTHPFGQPLPAG